MHAHGASSAVGEDENRGKSSYRWVMLGLACFLYASFAIVNASLAPLIAPVAEELDLSRTAMGSILGAWPFIYLFVALPAGRPLCIATAPPVGAAKALPAFRPNSRPGSSASCTERAMGVRRNEGSSGRLNFLLLRIVMRALP